MPSAVDEQQFCQLVTKEELNLESPIPLYKQLAQLIEQKIDSQSLKVGQRLQTEQSLSKELGLSISTVRRAYTLLVEEGLVSRRAGRGTFVSRPKLSRNLIGLYNFTEEIEALGRTPSSQVLSFCVTKPTDTVADAMRINTTDDIYEISRVRCADGKPILLETSYVPVQSYPGLSESNANSSLYQAMAHSLGATPASAYEVHEASTLSKREATLLERNPGDPTFRITRITKNNRDEVCEYCRAVAPGDQTCYTIELGSNGTKITKVFPLGD